MSFIQERSYTKAVGMQSLAGQDVSYILDIRLYVETK